MHAAWGGTIECFNLLLQNNASVSQCDNKGMTPLMHAAWGDNKECLDLLLQNDTCVVRNATTDVCSKYTGNKECFQCLT